MVYYLSVRQFGGVAQLARAIGSYPIGQGFKSILRYHGPLVKRLRHRPFTAVTAVRFCYGSPTNIGAQARPGSPWIPCFSHGFSFYRFFVFMRGSKKIFRRKERKFLKKGLTNRCGYGIIWKSQGKQTRGPLRARKKSGEISRKPIDNSRYLWYNK